MGKLRQTCILCGRVPGQVDDGKTVTLYCLPNGKNDQWRREEWIRRIRFARPDIKLKLTGHERICCHHFDSTRHLKSMVPALDLLGHPGDTNQTEENRDTVRMEVHPTELSAPVVTQPNQLQLHQAAMPTGDPTWRVMPVQEKVYMDSNHSSQVMRQLSQLWQEQQLCDAIITNSQDTLKAHKVVLIATCPVFKSMDRSVWTKTSLLVNLPSEVGRDAINAFLVYIYDGMLRLTAQSLPQMKRLAKIMMEDTVLGYCTDFETRFVTVKEEAVNADFDTALADNVTNPQDSLLSSNQPSGSILPLLEGATPTTLSRTPHTTSVVAPQIPNVQPMLLFDFTAPSVKFEPVPVALWKQCSDTTIQASFVNSVSPKIAIPRNPNVFTLPALSAAAPIPKQVRLTETGSKPVSSQHSCNIKANSGSKMYKPAYSLLSSSTFKSSPAALHIDHGLTINKSTPSAARCFTATTETIPLASNVNGEATTSSVSVSFQHGDGGLPTVIGQDDGNTQQVKPDSEKDMQILRHKGKSLYFTRSHRSRYRYKCDQCSTLLYTEPHMIQHMKDLHLADSEHAIDFVTAEYKKDYLPRACALCKHHARSMPDLHYHRYFKHQIPLPKECKLVHCKVCGREFSRESTLREHMNTHKDNASYVCEICGRGFARRANVVKHVYNCHNPEKKFKCKKCGKGFKRKSGIEIHLRLHAGVRPFKCPQCSYASATKDNLRVHMHTRHKQSIDKAEVPAHEEVRNLQNSVTPIEDLFEVISNSEPGDTTPSLL